MLGRKSNTQKEYEAMPYGQQAVVQLEKLNHNMDRLITTNITVSRDQERLLKFIADVMLKSLEIQNTNQHWTTDIINGLKKRLHSL